MSYLHDDVVDEDLRSTTHPAHREVTLGTGTILAIFTGLVLLCGLFFGLGYNMGSKSHPEIPAAATAEPSAPAPNFDRFKPSAGSTGAEPKPSSEAPRPAPAHDSAASSETATPGPTQASATDTRHPRSESTEAPAVTPPVIRQSTPPPPARPVSNTPDVIGSFTVQVAAVSHEEDADLLVGALKRKGYAVNARTTPQDKLFHIQVGPFTSKHEAEAMRQRLLGDGYNAIVK